MTAIESGGQEIAIQAAKNFWALRSLGVTVRKTNDTVIATRCIENGSFGHRVKITLPVQFPAQAADLPLPTQA